MNDSYQPHHPRHRGYAPEPPTEPASGAQDGQGFDQTAERSYRRAAEGGDQGYEQSYDQGDDPGYDQGYDPAYDRGYPQDGMGYEEEFFDEAPRKRGYRSVIAALIALVVIVGGVAFGGTKAYHYVKDHLSSGGGDYSASDTHGSVTFTVTPSESGTQMARELKSLGVVESVDAFIGAYNDNSQAQRIAPGTYKLQLGMPAAAAIKSLLDPSTLLQTKILIREGLRTADVVAVLDQHTKYSAKDFTKVLAHPASIGLPASAGGNAEGYLFPATYGFAPGAKPAAMLSQMVSAWKDEAGKIGLADTTIDGHAYTAQQVMTVASLVQEEGKTPQDMAKIARVIYNRVEHPGAEGQDGSLQIDATVDFAMGRPLTVGLTDADRQYDSPYNTFQHTGLPPGPIGNPGAAAMEAALHPAQGDWYYYITVNLASGATKFAHTYSEFLHYKAEHEHYCATQSASGCQ